MSVKDTISDLFISPHPLFGRASFTFSRASVPSSDIPPSSCSFLRFPSSWDTSACTFRAFRRGSRILCVPLPYTLGTRGQLLRNSSSPASASLSGGFPQPSPLPILPTAPNLALSPRLASRIVGTSATGEKLTFARVCGNGTPPLPTLPSAAPGSGLGSRTHRDLLLESLLDDSDHFGIRYWCVQSCCQPPHRSKVVFHRFFRFLASLMQRTQPLVLPTYCTESSTNSSFKSSQTSGGLSRTNCQYHSAARPLTRW
ncbi:uncharacterized protein LOC117893584 [Drosophila subobscura]|uniref:uncharacterized protein LOC117893584 n=1 Tax=Drosophila subobscura TaxID=7241 RepID=UPI00155AD93F|nr:uncharacterized protein LOC117893584 [Drosophila subobscura]